jgi:hypothetical protein
MLRQGVGNYEGRVRHSAHTNFKTNVVICMGDYIVHMSCAGPMQEQSPRPELSRCSHTDIRDTASALAGSRCRNASEALSVPSVAHALYVVAHEVKAWCMRRANASVDTKTMTAM